MTAHRMCVCCSWFESRRRRAAEVQRVADMERAGFLHQTLRALIELQQDPFSTTVTYMCCVCCASLFSLRCAGKQLLNLWDSLCRLLRARQVSVEDVSNKSGMLLRVLHTAAYGTTW